MNQTPNEPNKQTPPAKKPQAPAQQQPQWNPYYRRNPDGTPGGHDRIMREQAARADAKAQQMQERQSAVRAAAHSKQEGQGLGEPIRRVAPHPVPNGTQEQMPPKKPQPKSEGNESKPNSDGTRYRKQSNGTRTRVYPRRRDSRAVRQLKRYAVVAVVLLLVIAALIIGVTALVRKLAPNREYTYDYNGQFTAIVPSEEAMPGEVPYLNMNYLAGVYSMTVSGSYDDMKFSTVDGEYVSFMPNSRVIMVNGNRHVMIEPALLREQQMWIPSDFVEEMFNGIEVKWNHEENTVTVLPKTVSETDRTPLPLTFRLRPVNGTQSTAENWEDGYEYLTDMSAYREAIDPANRDAYLMLVNKENALSTTYTPTDLVNVTNMKAGLEGNTQQMCEVAELALQALYRDLYAAGYTDVGVTSGYRSYKTQEYLHESYVIAEMDARGVARAEAEQYAGRYSARAGQSEHQTGLAVDMYNTSKADVSFGDTEAYRWLKDHAHQYGFILRYPTDKTEITGYDFEPWHYRYVGRYHATVMYKQGLCLEEYLKKLN